MYLYYIYIGIYRVTYDVTHIHIHIDRKRERGTEGERERTGGGVSIPIWQYGFTVRLVNYWNASREIFRIVPASVRHPLNSFAGDGVAQSGDIQRCNQRLRKRLEMGGGSRNLPKAAA